MRDILYLVLYRREYVLCIEENRVIFLLTQNQILKSYEIFIGRYDELEKDDHCT